MIYIPLAILAITLFALLYSKRKPSVKVQPTLIIDHYQWGVFDIAIVNLINEYRLANGSGAVNIDSLLLDLSFGHSEYMANVNRLSHDNFENREAFMHPHLIGEVVAYGHKTPESVVAGWKRSEKHNACLLKPNFTKVGVSHSFGKDGKRYVTAIFS
jgi:uncharacterized protein YkwD